MSAAKKSKQPQKIQKTPRPWYLILLRGVLLFAVVPYAAIVLLFVVFQRSLIYRPTVSSSLTAEECGIPDAAVDVRLQTKDGKTLNGWLLKAKGTRSRKIKHPLVIYFPGNAGHRLARMVDLEEYAALDFDVLIFDYRGYGDSAGSPSQPALESDAKQIWEFVHDKLGYDASHIVVFGESLGGAVALSLWSADVGDANRPNPAAVILNSTFYSMSDMASWHYPWFPFRIALRDRWPSFERIRRVTSPVIIFHGTEDRLIPFKQGQQLASQATNGRLISIQGGTHNLIPVDQIGRELEQIRGQIGLRDEEEKSKKDESEPSNGTSEKTDPGESLKDSDREKPGAQDASTP